MLKVPAPLLDGVQQQLHALHQVHKDEAPVVLALGGGEWDVMNEAHGLGAARIN